jgi:polyisoprenoid-binding protein YceI
MTRSFFAPLGAVVATFAVLVLALVAPRSADAVTNASNSYAIDTSHSSLVFKVRHAGIADFYGRFNDIRGTLEYDEANIGASSIRVTVNAGSVDTANEKRDNHLRSPDFFNSRQFPSLTFTSTSVAEADGGLVVQGEFEMLGKKMPVTAQVDRIGSGEIRGKRALGFTAHFTVRRSDFGMTYGLGGSLGDDVEVTLAIEAIQG